MWFQSRCEFSKLKWNAAVAGPATERVLKWQNACASSSISYLSLETELQFHCQAAIVPIASEPFFCSAKYFRIRKHPNRFLHSPKYDAANGVTRLSVSDSGVRISTQIHWRGVLLLLCSRKHIESHLHCSFRMNEIIEQLSHCITKML